MKLKALDICMLGVATASLTAVKFALSGLANIELISVLLVWYALSFGKKAYFVSNIFIIIECFIYGFGSWVISYFLHWNCIVLGANILAKKGVKKSIFYALIATLLTFLFGVQSTIFETIFYSSNSDFFATFVTKYFMGLTFFVTHIACVFVSVFVLLPPLSKIPIIKDGYIVKF